MVKFTPEQLRECMSNIDNVRNVSVIAHVDHGKTTLTDQLLSRAGVLAKHQAGTRHATDTREDEQLRGITIKSTAISLYYELDDEAVVLAPSRMKDDEGSGLKGERGFLINLIDSPGHVDFSSEVTAALRLTDGAMVVVDCVSGVCVQTETVLRQAVTERIQPILMMNKLDRCILEKQMDMEDLYLQLSTTLMKVNTIVQTYHEEGTDYQYTMLDPSQGNVAMGSGLHGWGFTLPQFAAFYGRRYKMDEAKMLTRLWGNNFYNPTTRKWRTTPAEGYIRGFNKFILEPLYKMLNASLSDPPVDMTEMLQKIDIHLTTEESELMGKNKMKAVMQKWLPAGDVMLQMMAFHLPSPRVAQAYRAELLYEGPMDDEAATAIKTCDPEGPLMLYVSKMVPSVDRGRFYAYGRVFAGTITSGMEVRILGPDYNPNTKTDVTTGNVTRTLVMMGSSVWPIHSVPCGNVVGMGGIDKYLRKTGTLTTSETAHNMRVMKFSVSPVVQVAVEPKVPSELPKLVEGFKRLVKSDPMVRVSTEESGQNVVAGAGELHLEIILNDLEEMTGIEIKRSDPIVSFRETVVDTSPMACLAKSANKHNRIWLKASSLAEKLVIDIDEDRVKAVDDFKTRARYLADNYDFDIGEARKLWCFGPETRGTNFLVDTSKGVQSLNSIRDSMMAGFQWATLEGPLCEERMRGVRYDVVDAMVHSDPAHYRGNQIIPAMRRACYSSVLSAQARLMEPVYLVEIQCPEEALGGVYSSINPRRGYIFEENQVCGTPLFNLKAYLPVVESFGFTESLRGSTSGKAFPQCMFDHWQVMPGDPYDVTTKVGESIHACRMRKGMGEVIPRLDTYLDKL